MNVPRYTSRICAASARLVFHTLRNLSHWPGRTARSPCWYTCKAHPRHILAFHTHIHTYIHTYIYIYICIFQTAAGISFTVQKQQTPLVRPRAKLPGLFAEGHQVATWPHDASRSPVLPNGFNMSQDMSFHVFFFLLFFKPCLKSLFRLS